MAAHGPFPATRGVSCPDRVSAGFAGDRTRLPGSDSGNEPARRADRKRDTPITNGCATPTVEAAVLVLCGECGDRFELSARRARIHRNEGTQPRCADCRSTRSQVVCDRSPTPLVAEQIQSGRDPAAGRRARPLRPRARASRSSRRRQPSLPRARRRPTTAPTPRASSNEGRPVHQFRMSEKAMKAREAR